MLDSASNNDTLLVHLKSLLTAHDLPTWLHPVNNWVRCYVHIINLSSKAVVGNWPNDAENVDLDEAQVCNPVALAHEVVRCIRGLSSRREAFAKIIKDGNANGWFKENGKAVKLKQLQLLRYVRTWWDSCFHMLSQLLELRPVSCHPRVSHLGLTSTQQAVDYFLVLPQHQDMAKYKISEDEWQCMQDLEVILSVSPDSGS
jgi:hypothetical protein